MDDYFLTVETVNTFADVIRYKTGGMNYLSLEDMISAVENMTRPSGTLSLQADGDYDVTDYSSIKVQTGGTGNTFSYGFNYDTGELTIIDADNPLPEEDEQEGAE